MPATLRYKCLSRRGYVLQNISGAGTLGEDLEFSCLSLCLKATAHASDHPSDLMRQFKSAACSPTPVRSTCLMEWMNLMPTLSGFWLGFQSAIKPSRPKALFLQRFPKLAANPVRPLLTDERATPC
jgi:hypothetical protein